jgi:glycosyltransferase involved in cell wall biosynthesis
MAFLTIITPTIDASRYIDEAVASVPRNEHAGAGIEHIVVHDGSRAFAERLRARYPWLRVIDGPGQGATAAGISAIAAASGDFVFLLNSDDRMVPGAITALASAAAAQPGVEVWTGGTRIFEQAADGREATLRVLNNAPSTALTLSNVLDDLPLLTARFVRRTVYERIGPWDERYATCSDREFVIRMVLTGVREAWLGVPVSELRMHDDSRTIRRPGRSVPDYLAQHIEIAGRHMAMVDLSPEVRRTFRAWHAREVLRKAYYEMRAFELAEAARTLARAFAVDAAWPWRVPSTMRARRLRRRGMTRRGAGGRRMARKADHPSPLMQPPSGPPAL